ncbi:DUF2384 domain-containing protein [Aquimarina sp. ERC-38]|uniref:type II RES/Xre toxin-antitoxin system antitoxin n=1 Tax=Aquimarina sp. ERC-38 TaxID=2949996 RepID=UPI002245A7A5|nr:antitoxin Xre-like helix-turn-helix domain-containing protein [Aquimarina sp. ERC-38]UZO82496.1 DUF2384 domain-containing protein [Aquimarina sp. ERC-38]
MSAAIDFFTSSDSAFIKGANDDNRSLLLIRLVREGIPYKEFEKIATWSPFTNKDWAHFLNISIRTLERHKEDVKVFKQEQSEKIVSIYQLMHYGTSVFEDDTLFFNWLYVNTLTLGGVCPKDLLDTTIGIQVVRDALGRLEHGVLA